MKFGKLFKFEFKESMRLTIPFYIGMLAMGVIASVFGLIFDRIVLNNASDYGIVTGFIGTTSASLMALSIVAVFAGLVVIMILNVVRFYRTVVGQQSYLTHTLPVSADEILFSKLLCFYIVMLGAAIAAAVAVGMLAMTFLFLESTEPLREIMEIIQGIIEEIIGREAMAMSLSFIAEAVLSVIGNGVLLFTAIVAAGVLVRKKKGLLGVGLYLGANSVISFCSTFFTLMLSGLFTTSYVSVINLYTASNLLSCVLYTAITVGGYFFMRWALTHKLNV